MNIPLSPNYAAQTVCTYVVRTHQRNVVDTLSGGSNDIQKWYSINCIHTGLAAYCTKIRTGITQPRYLYLKSTAKIKSRLYD
jgi:hypothetical protein